MAGLTSAPSPGEPHLLGLLETHCSGLAFWVFVAAFVLTQLGCYFATGPLWYTVIYCNIL